VYSVYIEIPRNHSNRSICRGLEFSLKHGASLTQGTFTVLVHLATMTEEVGKKVVQTEQELSSYSSSEDVPRRSLLNCESEITTGSVQALLHFAGRLVRRLRSCSTSCTHSCFTNKFDIRTMSTCSHQTSGLSTGSIKIIRPFLRPE
jgi:hypothetical protein